MLLLQLVEYRGEIWHAGHCTRRGELIPESKALNPSSSHLSRFDVPLNFSENSVSRHRGRTTTPRAGYPPSAIQADLVCRTNNRCFKLERFA